MIMVILANLVKQFGDVIINDLVEITLSGSVLNPEETNALLLGYEQLLISTREILKKEHSPPPQVMHISSHSKTT